MVIAVFKDGPVAGNEVEIPVATPTLTMRVGTRTVEYERVGPNDGLRVTYAAKSVVERAKTPRPKKTDKRPGAKAVPAVRFTGGQSN